jgi:hypothetical protein
MYAGSLRGAEFFLCMQRSPILRANAALFMVFGNRFTPIPVAALSKA